MHVKGKEKIVAALDIGYKICQLDLYKKEEASILGNIYIGKVKNIAENIRAAFIEIENGTVCYYSLEEKAEPFFVNQKKKQSSLHWRRTFSTGVQRADSRQTPLRNL